MQKKLVIALVFLISLLVLAGNFTTLINWVQDYTSDAYGYESIRTILELTAFLVYTYFGVRFYSRHVDSLR